MPPINKHLAILFASTLAIGAGCGAKVVYVEDDDGQGGSSVGGSGQGGLGQGGFGQTNSTNVVTTVSSTVSSSSGVDVFCQNEDCQVGQVACECRGQCTVCDPMSCSLFGTVEVCEWSQDGAKCDCLLDNGSTLETIGSCFQLDLNCDTTAGCCAELFREALDP